MLYDAERGDFTIALTGDCMLTRRLSVFGEERFQALVNILWNSGDHQTFRRGRPRARRNWEEPGRGKGARLGLFINAFDETCCFEPADQPRVYDRFRPHTRQLGIDRG